MMSRGSNNHHNLATRSWTTFTDSSFDTGGERQRQQGWLVCATNKYFNQERAAPRSVLHWRSRKLTRNAVSPQLVETRAAISAVVEMTWIKWLWESMTWRDFDFRTQRRSSQLLKNLMPQVIRNENHKLLRSREHSCHRIGQQFTS